MPIPVSIPRLGWNMEEGIFVEWLKTDGDSVKPGDAIFRLEGEKATEDIESLDAGTLHIPADGPRTGDKLAVGAVIGYLLQPGELAPEARTPGRDMPASDMEIDTGAKPCRSARGTYLKKPVPRLPRAPDGSLRGSEWMLRPSAAAGATGACANATLSLTPSFGLATNGFSQRHATRHRRANDGEPTDDRAGNAYIGC